MKAIILSIILLSAVNCFASVPEYYYFDLSCATVKTIYDGKGKVIGTQEYRAAQVTLDVAYGSNTITKPGKDTEVAACRYSVANGRLAMSMGVDAEGKDAFLDYSHGAGINSCIVTRTAFETTVKLAGKDIPVSCTVTNRRVTAASEAVSSPAGEWNCVRTEYDMELKGRFLGIGIPVNVHIVEWFAHGTGIVRTDVYRRGKLYETRLLTGFRDA